MSWFVDASVVVAIIGREEDWEVLAGRLDADAVRLWSPMSQWESVAGTRSRLRTTAALAREQVFAFGADWNFTLVPIGQAEAAMSLAAYERFGKGTGHRAQLNMGDCFAYACARTNGAKLLYKGNDFIHTDLR